MMIRILILIATLGLLAGCASPTVSGNYQNGGGSTQVGFVW